MQNFFKEIKDNGVIRNVCDILKAKSNQITAIHSLAAECLSILVCPVHGDFYSFPWKRGPHDSILEYTEASVIFEGVREMVFAHLKEFDFVTKLLSIF